MNASRTPLKSRTMPSLSLAPTSPPVSAAQSAYQIDVSMR